MATFSLSYTMDDLLLNDGLGCSLHPKMVEDCSTPHFLRRLRCYHDNAGITLDTYLDFATCPDNYTDESLFDHSDYGTFSQYWYNYRMSAAKIGINRFKPLEKNNPENRPTLDYDGSPLTTRKIGGHVVKTPQLTRLIEAHIAVSSESSTLWESE